MQQFFLSSVFSEDMKMHLEATLEANLQALQWYAHRITIKRRKCVILMERQSHYTMVFCGLRKSEFEKFPQLFQQRLLQEIIAIYKPGKEDLAILSNLIPDICVEQHYQTDSDQSIKPQIILVADQLSTFVADNNNTLPLSFDEVFAFGSRVNEMPGKRESDAEDIYPREVFQRLWLGLINAIKSNSSHS